MPIRRFERWRLLLLGLTASLLAVLGLDATAIVAAPAAPSQTSVALPATITPPDGLRRISWSGHQWLVSPDAQPGPSAHVHMTDSPKAVWVDKKGRLHLHIIKVKGVWRSVQLQMLGPASYGTYRWTVRGDIGKFSNNTVLGLFVYENTGQKFANEIDIEDSRFTRWIHPNDAQYVVQPYYGEKHWCPYRTQKGLKLQTQQFTWTPGRVAFTNRRGSSGHGSPVAVKCDFNTANRLAAHATGSATPPHQSLATRHSFVYSGDDVPAVDHQRILINLWTNKNRAPTHGTHHIVLDKFELIPAD